jgi:hypothetical protein
MARAVAALAAQASTRPASSRWKVSTGGSPWTWGTAPCRVRAAFNAPSSGAGPKTGRSSAATSASPSASAAVSGPRGLSSPALPPMADRRADRSAGGWSRRPCARSTDNVLISVTATSTQRPT